MGQGGGGYRKSSSGRLVHERLDDLETTEEFRKLLRTLPSGEPVPDGVVRIGLLSGHLTVRTDGVLLNGDYVRAAATSTESTPTVEAPSRTVEAVLWFLGRIRAELEADRKKRIGDIVRAAELNTVSSRDERSQEQFVTVESALSKNRASGGRTSEDRAIERDTSSVSRAKTRARREGRDAAIDPVFNENGNKNHLLNDASDR